jgi:hypothetical protein
VRNLCATLLLLTAACQSEAHRLLVVDYALSDPLTLDATAAPWHDAGYRVEYRRSYPHLTRSDLTRYHAVLVLGGREPAAPSDALTIGDVAILNEWLRRDGVVVLAYADGANDRWVMNQWLAAQGAGITVGGDAGQPDVAQLIDATPLPHSALDNAGFAPFPAGRNRALRVRDSNQMLARAGSRAMVAASRVHEGLIVVTSRDLLGAARAAPGTRDFLVALARWTRRPAEWASVGEAVRPAPLHLAAQPPLRPVAVHAPPLDPPAGAVATTLPQPLPARDSTTVSTPNWITRQGMRVLWSRFTLPALDSLLGFAEVAALNALATTIPPAAIVDTLSTRNLWKITADRLQATTVRWFPAVSLTAIPVAEEKRSGRSETPSPGAADEIDRHGDLVPIPCGLDSLYWRNGLRPVYRILARLGGARPAPDVIAGVALDLDSAMTLYQGSGFCDADYRVGLAALGLERAELDRLLLLPPPVRYDTLLERGWVDQYFAALESSVAERAIALRTEVRRVKPDIRFAFHARETPTDWFSLGLLRGLSSADAPVLLWVRDQDNPRTLLRRYGERGIYALSALGLEPTRTSFAQSELARLRVAAFTEQAGFWLEGAASDSVGRVIRRFTK